MCKLNYGRTFIHVGCHAPLQLPLSVSRGFDYIKMNSRAFHKESETHFE